jgi:antitoxin component YwqK of YwqJK toxin-antitoxin module
MIDKLHYGGGSVFSITFAYDGELLVRKDCGFEGQDTASIYYSYDDEGRLQSVSDNKHPMPIETYLYDENGRKEWTFTHDGESDSIISSYHTQYDLLGRVEEEVQYGVEFENQVLETHTYIYDSDGNLKEEKVENADGVTLVLYEYDEYDEFGSWTLCYKTEYQVPSSNGKKTRTTRILTYY